MPNTKQAQPKKHKFGFAALLNLFRLPPLSYRIPVSIQVQPDGKFEYQPENFQYDDMVKQLNRQQLDIFLLDDIVKHRNNQQETKKC